MSIEDSFHDYLLTAYKDLNEKMEAAGVVIAPGEQVEAYRLVKFNDADNTFVLVVNTIPDPRLPKSWGVGAYVEDENAATDSSG